MATSKSTIKTKKLAHIGKADIATQREARGFMKQSEGNGRIAYDSIVVREMPDGKKFNLREDFGDLESLADSIEAIGLQFPLIVDTLTDGTNVLSDGERRYRAIGILRSRSKELKDRFEFVEAKRNDRTLTETDRLVVSLTANTGKQFEPLEEAEGFKRLRDGWNGEKPLTMAEISRMTGRSLPYVEQRLLLADASPEEQEMVRSGQASATAIQTLAREEKDATKRVKHIKKTIVEKKGKKFQVKDAKVSGPAKLCDDGLAIIKKLQKERISGIVANSLIELDALFRGIKTKVK